jgi:SAM-dependent methyltransferase
MALELARHGFHVTGLELSAECVRVAARLLEENPFHEGFGSLNYIAADFLEWPCQQHFDAVCFFLTLHHFHEPAKVLDKVVSLLQPGGTIVVIEPARDWFSTLNAAVATLIRLLLSCSGRWYEKLPLPRDPGQLDGLVQDCLREFQEARDRYEALQSPHDNASFAEPILAALRERFDQTACRPGYAILPRMIGGVRGRSEEETLAIAGFLRVLDDYGVQAGLLQPGCFYFAGCRR